MSTKNELFEDIRTHLNMDAMPSRYLQEISKASLFQEYPFDMLSKLKEVEQSKKYHPEGSVWNHTLLVVDEAAKIKDHSKYPEILMWAALLHDIGKPDTTINKNGKITSYNHDKVGAELAGKFLHEFMGDDTCINEVVFLVRWHMQVLFVEKNLPFKDIQAMRQQVDFKEVGLLALADRLGRIGADREKEVANIERFLQQCEEVGQ